MNSVSQSCLWEVLCGVFFWFVFFVCFFLGSGLRAEGVILFFNFLLNFLRRGGGVSGPLLAAGCACPSQIVWESVRALSGCSASSAAFPEGW